MRFVSLSAGKLSGMTEPKIDSRTQWKNTILAGLANYIDAGSIVAGAAGLALWAELYGLSSSFVGLIAAFSSNAISAGVGALVGGWLCDRSAASGSTSRTCCSTPSACCGWSSPRSAWMIVFGYVLVGLAVGADIPASWSLIAETRRAASAGSHAGVAQVLWMLGPVVVLMMSLVLSPLGVLGARIVFAHLLVVALVLWAAAAPDARVRRVGRGAGEGRGHARRRARAVEAALPRGDALPRRHVRLLEPVGGHQRLLPSRTSCARSATRARR